MLLLTFLIGACGAVDGDTLKCDGQRIRLLRVNSVERGEPGYQEAKDHLAVLIAGKPVVCRWERRDRYGRILAECEVGVNLSDEMLRSGYARKY